MQEKKKTIKMSFKAALLIVVAIETTIIIACLYVIFVKHNGYSENTITKVNAQNNEEKVTEDKEKEQNIVIDNTKVNSLEINPNNESKKPTLGIKLLQFDTEFYNLKEVALGYRDLSKIKNYKDFEYDLDGDGKKDKITIKMTEKDEIGDRHKIYLDGKEFYAQDSSNGVEIYIIDTKENDNKIEIIIHEFGANDINFYKIYTKQGTKMNKILEIAGWQMYVDKKGKIVIDNSLLEPITPKIFDVYYEFDGEKISKKMANLDNIKNITLKADGGLCFTKDQNSLNNYHNRDFSDKEYEENFDEKKSLEKYGIYYDYEKSINFKIIKFVENSSFANGCMHVKLEDGREGYLFSFAYNLAG